MAAVTNTLSERAASELNAILFQFTSGEAEGVRAYFERPHTAEENLDVLLRQMGREIQAANRLRMAADMFDELEDLRHVCRREDLVRLGRRRGRHTPRW